jgi:hypothetical protein
MLNWTSNNPNFGSNDTLVVTLDVAATIDMTLSIPYTSTIAGVPAGIMSVSITKGQISGRTTLNLSGATGNSKTGVITVHSTTFNQTSNPYASYIISNGIPIILNMSRGHTCVELDPTTLTPVVNAYSKNTAVNYDTYGKLNSASLDSWLAAVKPGNIFAIGSYDATSLNGVTPTGVGNTAAPTSTRTYLKNIIKTVPKKIPTTLPDTWTKQRLAHAIIAVKGSTSPEPVELISNNSVTANFTAPGFSTLTTGGTVTTTSGTLVVPNTPSNISLTLRGGGQAFNMAPKTDSVLLYPAVGTSTTKWNYTMVNYAVWPTGNTNPPVYPSGTFVFTKTFDIPTAGQYAIVWCVDNYGTVTLDDTTELYIASSTASSTDSKLPSLATPITKDVPPDSPYLYTLTQGSHTLRFQVTDPGPIAVTNPNGVALVVYSVIGASVANETNGTLTNLIWSTRSQLP